MEFQKITGKIGTVQTVFDETSEHPLDCVFTLPEYLPDIANVLKCIIRPVMQSHQIGGDRVMAEGSAEIRVLYLDEEQKQIYSFEMTQPFSSAFTVHDLIGTDTVEVSVKMNYVNCRATGPRRVDIHGALTVQLTVKRQAETEVLTAIEDEELCFKEETVAYSVPAVKAEKVFGMNEVVDLGNGGEHAQMPVRTQACIQIEECHLFPGKAIVKGETVIKVVCSTDVPNGEPADFCYRIPFSQIVDADGLQEDSLCDCKARLLVCDIRPTQNPNGETKLLSVTLKIAVSLCAYVAGEETVLTDAYHTRYALNTVTEPMQIEQITSISRDMAEASCELECPMGADGKIVDLWWEEPTVSAKAEEDSCRIDGQTVFCMIAADENGGLSYYERPATLSVTFPGNDDMAATMTILNAQAVKSGDRLTVHAQVQLCRVCTQKRSLSVITDLSADETVPFTPAEGMERCGMKVYFAQAGETVWEIAKAQHIRKDALLAENELTEDCLSSPTMLLIPLQ